MSDDRISTLLSALPSERAAGDFTRRVLARLDEPFRPPARLAPRLAFAAALAAAAALPLLLRDRGPQAPPGRAARLEALSREQERLAVEIEALKSLASDPAAVVYLGGDEETDVLIDLDRLARRRQAELRPASYRPPRDR